MPTGYKWRPTVRIVPQNGRESVTDLSTSMTDSLGASKITLDYKAEMARRKDANHADRSTVFGFRPIVTLEFSVLTMADVQHLAAIAAAANVSGTKLYLSLDGMCVEREALLVDFNGPTALAGKTIVGAEYSLKFECVDLIEQPPDLMTDPQKSKEYVQNGGFEQWGSATSPFSWTTEVDANCSVNEDTADEAEGATCARIDTTAAATPIVYQGITNIRPGISTVFSMYHKVTAGGSYARVYFRNLDRNKSWNRASQSWQDGVPSVNLIAEVSSTGWQLSTVPIPISADFVLSDTYSLVIFLLATGAQSLYLDAVSLAGPSLAEGYSTW